MSNRPMQIDCRWFLRGHLDVHCRKTVSALRQYNAPASLESSERKIKISKRLCIVEVAREFALSAGEKITKALKFEFDANGAGPQTFLTSRRGFAKRVKNIGAIPRHTFARDSNVTTGTSSCSGWRSDRTRRTHVHEGEKYDLPLVR